MTSLNRRKLKKWFKLAVIIYVLLGLLLYFFQEKFLFHPKSLKADHKFAFDQPFEEINIPVSPEKNINIIRFTVPDSTRRGVVLYFHGNRQNVERYAPFARFFTRNHYEVWMPDYPGFGKTTGARSEEAFNADATEVYKMIRARFAPERIILYGKSLGTGPATYLASRIDCARLILETPYTSIPDLFGHYAFIYPTGRMSKYAFPSIDRMATVQAPVTIFHGTSDGVIPYKQAVRLQRKAGSKVQLITIKEGEHNNLADFPLYQSSLDSLLNH